MEECASGLSDQIYNLTDPSLTRHRVSWVRIPPPPPTLPLYLLSLYNTNYYTVLKMKITIDNTDVLEGIEFQIITPEGDRTPKSTKTFFIIVLLRLLQDSVLVALATVPAILYVWAISQYWVVLKAEGLTLWQIGAGLVALYGLILHWWRTSIQSKLYQIEMKKAHHSLL